MEKSSDKIPVGNNEKLKKFVIPKKESNKKELLENVLLNSPEYQREYYPILVKSSYNQTWFANLKIEKFERIFNEKLHIEYLERKRELKFRGYNDRELCDGHAFLLTYNPTQVRSITNHGLTVNASVKTVLGHPNMAVCLQKHFDVLFPEPLSPNFVYKVILFKYIKGKVKTVAENHSFTNYLEPTPKYDVHLSKNNLPVGASFQAAYYSSQIYLYEYGEDGTERRPRHVYPFAIITFLCKATVPSNLPLTKKPSILKPVKPESRTQVHAGESMYNVWSGALLHRSSKVAEVGIFSSSFISKPTRIGGKIQINKAISASTVRKSFLGNLTRLSKKRQCPTLNHYLSYFEMRCKSSSSKEISNYQKFVKYLKSNDRFGLGFCEKNVVVIMMPNCLLAQQLGLINPKEKMSKDVTTMHWIFVSKTKIDAKFMQVNGQFHELMVGSDLYDCGYKSEVPHESRLKSSMIKACFEHQHLAYSRNNQTLAHESYTPTYSSTSDFNLGLYKDSNAENYSFNFTMESDSNENSPLTNVIELVNCIVYEIFEMIRNKSSVYLSLKCCQTLVNHVNYRNGEYLLDRIQSMVQSHMDGEMLYQFLFNSANFHIHDMIGRNAFKENISRHFNISDPSLAPNLQQLTKPADAAAQVMKCLSNDPRLRNRSQSLYENHQDFSKQFEQSDSDSVKSFLSPRADSLQMVWPGMTAESVGQSICVDSSGKGESSSLPPDISINKIMSVISNPDMVALVKDVLSTAEKVKNEANNGGNNSNNYGTGPAQQVDSHPIDDVDKSEGIHKRSMQMFDYGHKEGTPVKGKIEYYISEEYDSNMEVTTENPPDYYSDYKAMLNYTAFDDSGDNDLTASLEEFSSKVSPHSIHHNNLTVVQLNSDSQNIASECKDLKESSDILQDIVYSVEKCREKRNLMKREDEQSISKHDIGCNRNLSELLLNESSSKETIGDCSKKNSMQETESTNETIYKLPKLSKDDDSEVSEKLQDGLPAYEVPKIVSDCDVEVATCNDYNENILDDSKLQIEPVQIPLECADKDICDPRTSPVKRKRSPAKNKIDIFADDSIVSSTTHVSHLSKRRKDSNDPSVPEMEISSAFKKAESTPAYKRIPERTVEKFIRSFSQDPVNSNVVTSTDESRNVVKKREERSVSMCDFPHSPWTVHPNEVPLISTNSDECSEQIKDENESFMSSDTSLSDKSVSKKKFKKENCRFVSFEKSKYLNRSESLETVFHKKMDEIVDKTVSDVFKKFTKKKSEVVEKTLAGETERQFMEINCKNYSLEMSKSKKHLNKLSRYAKISNYKSNTKLQETMASTTDSVLHSLEKNRKRIFFHIFMAFRHVCSDLMELLIDEGQERITAEHQEYKRFKYKVDVYIHTDNINNVNSMSSLYWLKNQPHSNFLLFNSVQQIKENHHLPQIFPRNGIVIADHQYFLKVDAASVSFLLEEIKDQNSNGSSWLLLVHSDIISDLSSGTSSKCRNKLQSLISYSGQNIWQLMESHNCNRDRCYRDAFKCAVDIQAEYMYTHRHIILVSDYFTKDEVHEFNDHGIGVFELSDFIDKLKMGSYSKKKTKKTRPNYSSN